jgi:hypothetical protein
MTLALSSVDDILFKMNQANLKNCLTYALNQQELFKRIDAIPGLSGAGVFYSGNESYAMLRPFK